MYNMQCHSNITKQDTDIGYIMRGSRTFCQGESNFDNVSMFFLFYFLLLFMLMRGGRIQIPLLAARQRPASETPFKLRFAGGPMMAHH